MSIGTKLVAVLGALVVLCALTGGVALQKLSSFREITSRMRNENVESLVYLEPMQSDLLSLRLRIRELFESNTPEERSAALGHISDLRGTLDSERQKYSKTVSTGEEQALFTS